MCPKKCRASVHPADPFFPVAVPHDFRSSFWDWAAEETNHPRDVIEAAYARSGLFERRRTLMADWARYLAHGMAKNSEPLR